MVNVRVMIYKGTREQLVAKPKNLPIPDRWEKKGVILKWMKMELNYIPKWAMCEF